MILAAIYMIIPGINRIHGNKCPFSLFNHNINLPYSVSCYLSVIFVQSTILDCLLAVQVKNEKETMIIRKLFCFKIICHHVHAQICGKFCTYKKQQHAHSFVVFY